MIRHLSMLICIFAYLAHALSPDGKCRILALKGGGVHGSYEAGVLKAFMEVLEPEEYRYDYISGVSIGALNTGIFSLYPPGEEKAATEELLRLYRTYMPKDFFKMWKKPVRSLFTKKSILDSSGMLETLAEIQDGRSFQRKLSFQSIDV